MYILYRYMYLIRYVETSSLQYQTYWNQLNTISVVLFRDRSAMSLSVSDVDRPSVQGTEEAWRGRSTKLQMSSDVNFILTSCNFPLSRNVRIHLFSNFHCYFPNFQRNRRILILAAQRRSSFGPCHRWSHPIVQRMQWPQGFWKRTQLRIQMHKVETDMWKYVTYVLRVN